MSNDDDDRDLMFIDDDPMPGGMGRWLPTAVVFGVVGGFIALAWYAYHAGMQSMKDDDLLVVEADKTPIKEKPLDPGGMKFPNQDKTIFETFNNGAQVPPKVERVVPAPEEPIKTADNSETGTWINDKLHKPDNAAAPSAPEQVIGTDVKKPDAPVETPKVEEPAHQVIEAKPAPEPETETYVAKPSVKTDTPKEPVAKAPVTPPQPEKKPEAKPAPKPAAKPAADTGAMKVQLGAYRSDSEAQAAWTAMQKKVPALSGKSPVVVKADLGEKGIYYRLRTGGFASSAEVKSFCASVTAKGQACIPVDK